MILQERAEAALRNPALLAVVTDVYERVVRIETGDPTRGEGHDRRSGDFGSFLRDVFEGSFAVEHFFAVACLGFNLD